MVDFAAHTARMINRVGQPVTVTPSGGPARSVMAVVAVSPADVFQAENYRYQARIALADADDLAVGDPLTTGAASYTVAAREVDTDSGDVLLRLK